MYHAERVIDGILHYKNAPQDDWIAYTPQQLTMRIVSMQVDGLKHNRELERLNEQLEKWIEKGKEVSA